MSEVRCLPRAYLCCSIRGGRSATVPYDKLVQVIGQHVTVVNPTVVEVPSGGEVKGDAGLTDSELHSRDIDMIRNCDVVVAEVSQPSFGVGYEVGRAIEWKKPVLCINCSADDTKLSAMISWAANEGSDSQVQLKSYRDADHLKTLVTQYFAASDCPVLSGIGNKNRNTSIDWNNYEPM